MASHWRIICLVSLYLNQYIAFVYSSSHFLKLFPLFYLFKAKYFSYQYNLIFPIKGLHENFIYQRFFLMYKFTTLSSRFHRMDYIYYNIYSIHVRNSFVLVTDERKISLTNECKYICIAIITNISTFVSKSF